ncbi:MAG: hypothetical protein DRG71_09880 [Deltaproteobacteria bacterium]|nr:MAG: hypothetical protein DRG71_09880 [Deltaproteobacteria bacterium]
MAGKTIPTLFVCCIEYKALNIYLASTAKGAVKICMRMGDAEDPVSFFSPIMPGTALLHSIKHNSALIQATRSALEGKTFSLDTPIDVKLTPFQQKVYETISRIPYGKTRTYGQVAKEMGQPNAARAVGQAMRANPLPIIFP